MLDINNNSNILSKTRPTQCFVHEYLAQYDFPRRKWGDIWLIKYYGLYTSFHFCNQKYLYKPRIFILLTPLIWICYELWIMALLLVFLLCKTFFMNASIYIYIYIFENIIHDNKKKETSMIDLFVTTSILIFITYIS